MNRLFQSLSKDFDRDRDGEYYFNLLKTILLNSELRAELVRLSINHPQCFKNTAFFKNLVLFDKYFSTNLNELQLSNLDYMFNYLLRDSGFLNEEVTALPIISFALKNRVSPYIPFGKYLPLVIDSYPKLIRYDKKGDYILPFDSIPEKNLNGIRFPKLEKLYVPILIQLSDQKWHYTDDIINSISIELKIDQLDSYKLENTFRLAFMILDRSRLLKYSGSKAIIESKGLELIKRYKVKKITSTDLLKMTILGIEPEGLFSRDPEIRKKYY
jgi:hypothetical protein